MAVRAPIVAEMTATVSILAHVPDPQGWVAEAHVRSGNLFAGMPVDLVPDAVRGITVKVGDYGLVAEVDADSESTPLRHRVGIEVGTSVASHGNGTGRFRAMFKR